MNTKKKVVTLIRSGEKQKTDRVQDIQNARRWEPKRTIQYWEEAIAELEDARFHSVIEAVDRVIDLVLDRIDTEAQSEVETRELLRCAFETDPELTDVLRTYLKIETER